jgi:hypothetical protein
VVYVRYRQGDSSGDAGGGNVKLVTNKQYTKSNLQRREVL